MALGIVRGRSIINCDTGHRDCEREIMYNITVEIMLGRVDTNL